MDATTASAPGQITGSLINILLFFLVIFVSETIYNATVDAANRFQTLVGYTVDSGEKSLVIHQDASKYKEAKTIGLSMNERTGIEFGYSFYLMVEPATFTGTQTMKHVFHKGYGCPWPLMGPGVFIFGHTNTMRVFMNTYKNPYTYVDIKNIPVQKWFHVVLNCYKGGLDVFVNGLLANRISFRDTLPYQNFQDIILFSNANYNSLRGSSIPSLGGENFDIEGAFKGKLSNLIYTRYAMSMNEIQTLLAKGPSAALRKRPEEEPPYLADDWWAHQA